MKFFKVIFLFHFVLYIPFIAVSHDSETAAAITFNSSYVPAFTPNNAPLGDFSCNNKKVYRTIKNEINALKLAYHDHTGTIPLSNEKSRASAPILCKMLESCTSSLATKADLQTPPIYLSIDENNRYNAHAQGLTATLVTKHYIQQDGHTTLIDQTASEITKHRITLDEELLKLILWRTEYQECLQAIIAHELGHIKYNHQGHNLNHEHEADLFALTLLEKPSLLITALDMIQCSSSLLTSLKSYSSCIPSTKTAHSVIRKTVNAVILHRGDLGELGRADSHTYFSTLVAQATKEVFSSSHGSSTIDYLNPLFEQLLIACNDPQKFFTIFSLSYLKQMGREIDQKNPETLTHPHPLARLNTIQGSLHA